MVLYRSKFCIIIIIIIQYEQLLVKLIHFWERSMINIVDGFQRKAVELMNNVNKK